MIHGITNQFLYAVTYLQCTCINGKARKAYAGTGSFIGKGDDAFLITNRHVVEPSYRDKEYEGYKLESVTYDIRTYNEETHQVAVDYIPMSSWQLILPEDEHDDVACFFDIKTTKIGTPKCLYKNRRNLKMPTINTAVIMAAGLGTRFGQMTEKMPKGFVPFKGEPMVVHSIKTLIDCGIKRIIIGTGYKKEAYEALQKSFPQIECVFSSRYAETNSMYTLYNTREAIGDEDFILLESDLVFEKKAITSLQECPYDNAMLITPVTKFQDQYYVEMDGNCVLTNCSTDKSQINPSGELVGIHKLSSSFYKKMCSEYEKIVDEKPKLGYEYQLLYISQHVQPMNVLKVDGLQWYEIDDIDDLKFAEENIKV